MNHTLLAPASLLPRFESWRAVLGELEEPVVLIVLPAETSRARRAVETLAARYRGDGRSVMILAVDQLAL